MPVPMLDLKPQYASIRDEVLKVTSEIFESQGFILGSVYAERSEASPAQLRTFGNPPEIPRSARDDDEKQFVGYVNRREGMFIQ